MTWFGIITISDGEEPVHPNRYGWIILACILFPVLLFVTAPYGAYKRSWGMTIPNRLGGS